MACTWCVHNRADAADRHRRELVVPNGDVSLAGSLWLPHAEPVAILLMHPGSGPSDRDNDAFFPPIREYLLEAGVAVSSFDKRGVGGSTGRWEEASIVTQADDALACCDALSAEAEGTRIGLFGHSQGGWVVVDAASRGEDVSFVVTSSGSGVTPGEQGATRSVRT
jgi:alpha/beta superfamily hydrolase